MNHLPLLSTTLLSLAAAGQSAPYQGFLFNWDRPVAGNHMSLVTRWNVTAESDLNRVDFDDFRDWGANASNAVVLRGLAVWMFDNNYATAQSFSFVGHAEDTANPNFPLTTAAFTVPNIPMPPGVTGNAYLVNGTLSANVTIPGGGDVFVGIGLPAMTAATPPYDGLWVGSVQRFNAAQPAITIYDEPGPRGQLGAGIFREDYACFISGGAPLYGPPSATSLSQFAIDVAINSGQVGGVALTETTQTSLVPSNAPRGTGDFLSGLHPDLNGLNPTRADNVGFGTTHHTGQMPIGSPVVILLALGPSPVGPIALNTLPGLDPVSSAGNICLDFTASVSYLALSQTGFLANMGEAQLMLPVSPQFRAFLATFPAPIDFWWQGFAIDLSAPGPNLEIRATGCVIQHIK